MAVIDRKVAKWSGDSRCPGCGGRLEEKGRDSEGRLILTCSSCGSIRIMKKAESGND